ncbi:MAG: hypothetical protein QXO70_02860 [Candidatus Pacearchaeota archaeon]
MFYGIFKFYQWSFLEIKKFFQNEEQNPPHLFAVFLYFPFFLLAKLIQMMNNRTTIKQEETQEKLETFTKLNDENEDLEKVKMLTYELINIEKNYLGTEIAPHLSKVISLQKQVMEMFYKNPSKFEDNHKRIILFYTNSILNVLRQWLELKKSTTNYQIISDANQRLIELLTRWYELLEQIQSNFVSEKYALLNAEIQSLLDGLKLDK